MAESQNRLTSKKKEGLYRVIILCEKLTSATSYRLIYRITTLILVKFQYNLYVAVLQSFI